MLNAPKEFESLPGSYQDVVKDYVQSHILQQNVEAMCYAIVLAIDHSEYWCIIEPYSVSW